MKTTLCPTCNKYISNNNIRKHLTSCNSPVKPKIRGIDFDPNCGYKDGSRVAWNKGLTADTDSRVANNASAISQSFKDRPATGCYGWAKAERSKRAKELGLGGYRENAGRSKKYKVLDSFGKEVCLQSSYELRCSEILNLLGIRWNRPRSLKYSGKNYFPDFYLPDYNIYLDPKNNYKATVDKVKIESVIEENNVNLYVILEEQLTEDYIAGLTQLARVAS